MSIRRTILPLLAMGFLWACSAEPASADAIVITEVVTDPQADHSESAGGNGLPYDLLPGTGTVSSVDEFVEIFNAGPAAVDLTDYLLEFDDSTPSSYQFGSGSGGVLLFSAGSSLESLLDGGYALVGNPPGALNNDVQVRLVDPLGALIDLFEVGDGNASTLLDEAVLRTWTGAGYLDEISRGPITPLAAPPPLQPVPEPCALLLVGASLLAGCAATARRVPPGRPRRPS